MATKARYSVGIDLGTTNSAMAYADLTDDDATSIDVLAIPQLVNVGEVSEHSLLPSFLYVAGEFDFPADSLRLPWAVADAAAPWVVGELARKRGSENPARLVASAKSWLSYAGASRTAPILPWGAPEEVPKLSPVAASAPLPAAPQAGVGCPLRCGRPGARARVPGRAHHRAGIV